jgi:uncharacterized membrane protein
VFPSVLTLVLVLLVVLGVAGAVIYAVAAPQVRAGAPVLTPDGERLARSARRARRRVTRRASGGDSAARAGSGTIAP